MQARLSSVDSSGTLVCCQDINNSGGSQTGLHVLI